MMVQRLFRMLWLRVGQIVAPGTPRVTISRTLYFTRTLRRTLRF